MKAVTEIIEREGAEILPMFFRHYVPHGPLSEFVGVFWYWQGHNVSQSQERVLPTGTVELVINLGSHLTSDSVISGAKSQSFLIERTTHDRLLGIHFKPGGAFPFLGFPCTDLHNIDITLADLWGEQGAAQLLFLLHEARTVNLKFQVLEKWMMLTSKRPLNHHRAVTFALKEFQKNPSTTSAEIASSVGLSQRRFIQAFHNEVGLTPKLFCRVQRFQQVIETVEKLNDVDWLDIALTSGYFDQAHFNHDFREFSGLSPREYLGLRTEHLHHVQVRS